MIISLIGGIAATVGAIVTGVTATNTISGRNNKKEIKRVKTELHIAETTTAIGIAVMSVDSYVAEKMSKAEMANIKARLQQLETQQARHEMLQQRLSYYENEMNKLKK